MTDKKSLFELTAEEVELKQELEAAMWRVDEETGEMVPDDPGKLTEFIKAEMASEAKIETLDRVIDWLNIESEKARAEWKAIAAIVDRPRARAQRLENAVKSIQWNVVAHMQASSKDEIILHSGRVLRLQNNPVSVKIDAMAPMSMWPEGLHEVEYKPNKKAIKEFCKDRDASEWPGGVEIIRTQRLVRK